MRAGDELVTDGALGLEGALVLDEGALVGAEGAAAGALGAAAISDMVPLSVVPLARGGWKLS
jgi:hypothetical protein